MSSTIEKRSGLAKLQVFSISLIEIDAMATELYDRTLARDKHHLVYNHVTNTT